MSLGFTFSHPLMCNVAPYNVHDSNSSTKFPSHTFEWMVTRSTHNNDLKGLRSMRNIEMSLSQTEVVVNFNKITATKDWMNFRHSYNLGKETITDKEIIFSDEVDAGNIYKYYFGDIVTLEEDICDSREVEYVRSDFVESEGSRCILMTLRNTMPYQVDIDIDSSTPSMSH